MVIGRTPPGRAHGIILPYSGGLHKGEEGRKGKNGEKSGWFDSIVYIKLLNVFRKVLKMPDECGIIEVQSETHVMRNVWTPDRVCRMYVPLSV